MSIKEDDKLLAGVLLSGVVPAIFLLTFELWVGQVLRSIRAGNVVAAIEQRLADLFAEQPEAEPLPPPMGWEQWLRRRDGLSFRWDLSQQQQESTVGAVVIFIFLFIVAAASAWLGWSFLNDRPDKTALHVVIGVAVFTLSYLIGRARFMIRDLRRRETVPPVDEIWPADGKWLGRSGA